MRTIVFLGPTLPPEEARSILPEATYLPPAAQGDLLSAVVTMEPDVVGLIDGVFLHTPSVWHKEILYTLERGIPVFGASSMGALRAAETSRFGMVGVGEIYQLYATERLVDDDEVALAHGPADTGYRKMSEPMVNVRATLAAAHAAGVLDEEWLAGVLGIAKRIHFTTRTFDRVLEQAAAEGVPHSVVAGLADFVRTGYVDLKARDAVALLETLRDLPEPVPRPEIDFTTGLNAGLVTMYNRDRRVVVDDTSVALVDVADYVALHEPDFPVLNFNALNRAAAVALARLVGLDVSDREIDDETARFRRRLSLEDDSAFDAWLRRNHLPRQDVAMFMRETAMCRAVHRWLVYALFMERTTRLVLDQLRWEDRYEALVGRAAAQERLVALADAGAHDPLSSQPTAAMVDQHEQWTGIRFDTDVARWAEEAGFNNKSDLRLGLTRSALARQAVLRLMETAMAGDDAPDAPAGTPDPIR